MSAHLTEQYSPWPLPPMAKPRSASSPPARVAPSPPFSPKKGQSRPTESFSLHDFTTEYSRSLPVGVRVVQGFYGLSSNVALHTDDCYNIHCTKHVDVVKIKDAQGKTYSVPMNSKLQFGLVSEASGDGGAIYYSECSHATVNDLLALPTLPKIICATKGDQKSLVAENEILVVLGLHMLLHTKGGLRVFSLSKRTTRVLPTLCTGHFSTNPAHVAMHLSDFVEFVPDPFPSQAHVFLTKDESTASSQKLLGTLLSKPVTLCEHQPNLSLIVSPASTGSKTLTEADLIEVPIDKAHSEIQVAIEPKHAGKDALRKQTKQLLETLDLTKIPLLKEAMSTRDHKKQSLINSLTQGESSVQIKSSFGVRMFPPLPVKKSALSGNHLDHDETIYEKMNPAPLSRKTVPVQSQNHSPMQRSQSFKSAVYSKPKPKQRANTVQSTTHFARPFPAQPTYAVPSGRKLVNNSEDDRQEYETIDFRPRRFDTFPRAGRMNSDVTPPMNMVEACCPHPRMPWSAAAYDRDSYRMPYPYTHMY